VVGFQTFLMHLCNTTSHPEPVGDPEFLKGEVDRTAGEKRSHSDRARPADGYRTLFGKGEAAALPPHESSTVQRL